MADFDFVETDSAKIYTDIIGALMDYCDDALYPGDERRIFGEALVAVFVALYAEFNDKMKQRTLQYARGAVLDAIGDRYNVRRLEPASATATFRFTASAAQGANIIIPAGTRITPDGNVYFSTGSTAIIPAGGSYVDVVAACTVGGSEYNGYSAGSIATIVDLIPYIANVQNITASAGGDDGEPYTEDGDNRFRERIRLAPSAQSTAGPESAYRFWVLSADPDIADVAFDYPEHEANVVNIYPLMQGSEIPSDETLKKIVDVLADDVRPMTDKVNVLAPAPVDFGIEIKYYCTKADEAALIEAIEGKGGAIDQYIAWQTAALGRAIDPDQLRSFIFAAKSASSATGTVRIDVVSPWYIELEKTEFAQFSGPPVVSHEAVIT